MTQLLLLNPPSGDDALANREGTASFGALSSGFLYPPHTLAVLVATCGQAGIEATVVDAVGERLSQDAVIAQIQKVEPDALAVYSSWGTVDADRAAFTALRAAFPRLPRIAVGAGARFSADELLIGGATHVLLGDPELALPELLSRTLPAPGIIPAHSLLPDRHNRSGLLLAPDLLPRPAWKAVPWQRYGFLTLFGARGCEDRCNFCAYVIAQGRSYRPRPAQDVAAEMLWLQETFHPRRIMVRDPVFAADRARTLEIARALSAARFHTPWECESRPEHFDADLLRQLAKASCTLIKLGIESADPDLLVAMHRLGDVSEAATYLAYSGGVVAAARRFGILTRVYVMVGLPGQTLAHTEATAAYLRELAPTFIHPRPFIAYPRLVLGLAQSAERIAQLMVPLQAVAAERQAIANRPPSPLARLQRRILSLRLLWGI